MCWSSSVTRRRPRPVVFAVKTTYFIVKIVCTCCFDMMGDVCSTCVLSCVCSTKLIKRWSRFPSLILIGQDVFFSTVSRGAQQGFASVEVEGRGKG